MIYGYYYGKFNDRSIRVGRTEEETVSTRAKMEDLLKVLVGTDVNQGGLQKTTDPTSQCKDFCKSHTDEEFLMRHRTDRHSQVLSGHADQTWEL